VENADIELVRPPITVHGFAGSVRHRALAGVLTIMSVHIFSPIVATLIEPFLKPFSKLLFERSWDSGPDVRRRWGIGTFPSPLERF
jgi:hypothetical protein